MNILVSWEWIVSTLLVGVAQGVPESICVKRYSGIPAELYVFFNLIFCPQEFFHFQITSCRHGYAT
jgi:hypothetical protein